MTNDITRDLGTAAAAFEAFITHLQAAQEAGVGVAVAASRHDDWRPAAAVLAAFGRFTDDLTAAAARHTDTAATEGAVTALVDLLAPRVGDLAVAYDDSPERLAHRQQMWRTMMGDHFDVLEVLDPDFARITGVN